MGSEPNSLDGAGALLSPTKRWRRPRVYVGLLLILLGLSTLLYPFLPSLLYALKKPTATLPYALSAEETQLIKDTFGELPVIGTRAVPDDNRLIIPSIGVDVKILEGTSERVLDQGGVWHIPNTGNPLSGSNIVLSGHRWKYLPPSGISLYLLDKVKDNEPIFLTWNGQSYTFRVRSREVVTPDRTDIAKPTTNTQLTIYTCTPLFSTSHRLVLYADLITS